jgi:hypothetical protein
LARESKSKDHSKFSSGTKSSFIGFLLSSLTA